MQRSLILSIAAVGLTAVLSGSPAGLAPAQAQTPVDGRIVRVVYKVGSLGTWGFHLAHMRDGRYCVRLGNPGRLTLAIIQQVADICFDSVPGKVDRSPERRSRAFNTRDEPITVVTYQKGSIAAAGNDITLDITRCSRVEGEAETHCRRGLYVVRVSGQDCGTEITAFQGKPAIPTCEHYAAH